jgi:hypothetical protein
MGFSKTTTSWFSVLSGEKKAEKIAVDSADAVDAMERGFARALARDEVKPEPAEGPTRKMHVERSADRLVHILHNEDGAPVLEARVTTEGVQVFAAGGEGRKARVEVPAFTMTHDKEQKNWKIASSYCENCAFRNPYSSCKNHGGQTLALVRHEKEEIGEGVAMCMDVDMPEIGANGQSAIWCPLCKSCDDSRIELNSLRPKWNAKLKSLCMDFKGKVDAASAKNFQLCINDKVVLVYGKKADGTFCLEFEHPLSPVQAFTIALTTMHWT